jgi:hypothetical protein
MIVTRKHLPRRTVLRGIGATVALPLLDCMVPAFAAIRSTAAKPVRRLGVVYAANGMAMKYWRPANTGPIAELAPIQQPLAPVRERVLVMSGFDSKEADAKDTAVHARIQATWLTGVRAKRTEGPDIHLGISLDQIAAREFGKDTQLASIEVSMEAADLSGTCLPGYSCAYNNTVSWRDATTPLPMEFDPRAVFERLFGTTRNTSPEARRARIHLRRSILDSIMDKTADLERTIGQEDRLKLDQYVDAIRDVERRLERAEVQASRELPHVDKPAGVPASFEKHAKLMFDLLLLAYQTDLTRVFAFALGRELSVRTFPEIGIPDAHHPLSHHQNDPEKIAKLGKLQTYQMQMVAYFVEKLRATPDGDGTLFDRTLLFYGSGMSDSNIHYMYDLPAMIVAGSDYAIGGGRYLEFKSTPLTNLQLTVLEKLGLPVEHFGDSTGRLELVSDVSRP